MTTYVYRDGSRLTPYMLYQINRLDADFYKEFGVHIKVTSGIRTAQEQLDIWYARYTLTPNGRKVYDTRWWNGRLWYRISSAGTVAQPKTSNHEIQGTRAAVDLRDTGRDAGVSVAGSRRSNWLRANASRYGLVASGFGFGEAWHYDVLGIFNAVPGGGGSKPVPKPKPNTKRRKKMSTGVIHTDDKSDSKRSGAIVNTESGLFSPFGWFPVSYANGIARGFGLEASAPVTRGSYNQIKADMAALRKANGNLAVDIADEDVPKIGS